MNIFFVLTVLLTHVALQRTCGAFAAVDKQSATQSCSHSHTLDEICSVGLPSPARVCSADSTDFRTAWRFLSPPLISWHKPASVCHCQSLPRPAEGCLTQVSMSRPWGAPCWHPPLHLLSVFQTQAHGELGSLTGCLTAPDWIALSFLKWTVCNTGFTSSPWWWSISNRILFHIKTCSSYLSVSSQFLIACFSMRSSVILVWVWCLRRWTQSDFK